MNDCVITLENVDEFVDFWQKECDDIHPANVDSMDRGCDIHDATARKAICLLPQVLEQLKDALIKLRLQRAIHEEY